MKYTNCEVVFREFPDEITLAFNISNCKIHCEGCHSRWLWQNTGNDLDIDKISNELKDGITCIGLMGGTINEIDPLVDQIKKKYPNIKIGWYNGGTNWPLNLENYDYIKLGPYKSKLGGLDNPNTNQKMYKIHHNKPLPLWGLIEDITKMFWK